MVIKNKKKLIEKMIGIHSSKKSYYLELKKKNEEISQINSRLALIEQLSQNMQQDLPFDQMIKDLIPKMQDLVHFHYLSIYLLQKNKLIKRILFFAGEGKEIKVWEDVLPKDWLQNISPEQADHTRSALNSVLQEKKPWLQKNIAAAAPSFPRNMGLTKQGVTAKIMLPLVSGEKVFGALEISGNKVYPTPNLPFLKQLASQLSLCLENMHLRHQALQLEQEWMITSAAVTDLLIFIDQDQGIQKVNKAARDFFTLDEKDILGQKCYALLYGRKTRCNPCLADQVRQSKKTVHLQARTRYNRVLDIFAYPAHVQGSAFGVAYYAKDITRFVDSVKFTSLGEMSAGVAHELNSPLTAIVGNSQLLLRETPPSSPHYQLIEDIKSCGGRCQRIIQNLLALSRQDEISFEEIDLNKVIEKAFCLVSCQLENKQIDLINKIAPSPQRIMGNSQGLEQIIVNLLLNARDAIEKKPPGPENGVLEKGRVVVSTRMLPEKFIAVDITDNGCGIEAGKIQQIFNPFHTTKNSGKGTGLGLSVSLGIAQAHGGFIDVESVPGQGSTFSLILPLHPSLSPAE